MPDELRPEDHEVDAPEDDGREVRTLDPETAARRAAALRQVRQYGDPVLTTRARPVEVFDDALREEVDRMARLMIDSIGVGLAATQVGALRRLLVYRVGADGPVHAVVNPVLEWAGDELETMEEGCLSLPGVGLDVERHVHVRVAGRDEHGDPLLIEASGLEARVLQHEMDHLDGVLILDRVGRSERKAAIKTMREIERAREERAA